jgi:4-hydroxy-tetrahydrodipicolinate synthase
MGKHPRRDDGGLYAYLMTPYNRKGDVDAGLLAEYVNAIKPSGIDGVTCIASTCEGPYLTERERHLVATTVGKAAAGRVKVNIGIGAVSTRQAIEYARQARDAGADSLMVDMQQYFPIAFEDAVRHYEAIAAAVPLPIRLYNITNPTRFDFTPARLAKMSGLSAVTSMKESSGDVTRVRDIKALCGDRFTLYCGFHFQSLDAFRFGALGWEAGLHPLIAKPCVDLYRTLRADPMSKKAEALSRRLAPLFHFFRLCGVPQSIKAMSQWTNLKLGRPRAPLADLSSQAKERLRQLLKDLDVL